ncbi:MAG: response regulator [Clostridia bacterium]|nr:response regulator [Clostridia bacterium]
MHYNILSVDKTSHAKAELSSLFKGIDVNILYVKDDIEALNTLYDNRAPGIDAIIWTIHSPNPDEFDVIKNVKLKEAYSHIPIIILSKFTDKKYIIKAIEVGAVEYIAKPYDKTTALNKIMKILGIKFDVSVFEKSHNDMITFNYSDMISRELKAASRGEYPMTMMLVSVTSVYPDIKKQSTISEIINLINKVIKSRIRETDTTFYYGINNLIILLPFVGRNAASFVEKKIHNIFKTHSLIGDVGKGFSLVAASVTYPEDGKIKEKLLEKLETNFKFAAQV